MEMILSMSADGVRCGQIAPFKESTFNRMTSKSISSMNPIEAIRIAEEALGLIDGNFIGESERDENAVAILAKLAPLVEAIGELYTSWVNADIGPDDLDSFDARIFSLYRNLHSQTKAQTHRPRQRHGDQGMSMGRSKDTK